MVLKIQYGLEEYFIFGVIFIHFLSFLYSGNNYKSLQRPKKRAFYGVIMAGGSLGALFGSEISKRFSNSFNEYGLELFSLSSALFLFFAMLLAIFISSQSKNNNLVENENVGGGSSMRSRILKNCRNKEHRLRMDLDRIDDNQWITAIGIVEEWSQDPARRVWFFATIEQVISPLVLFVQLFLTNIIIKKFGIRNIMFLYGCLFLLAYLALG